MESRDSLIRLLRTVQRRMFIQRWVRGVAVGVALAACAACLWVVAARLFPQLGEPFFVAVGLLAFGYLAGSIYAWRNRPSLLDAAIQADRHSGLRERITSSLELAEEHGPMVDAVHADARRRIEGLNLSQQFPLMTSSRLRWVYAPLLILGVAYMALPEFDLFNYEDRQAEAKMQKEAVAVKVEHIREELKPLKELAASDQEGILGEMTADIEAMTADLEQGTLTERQALAKLSNLADDLAERREAFAKQGAMPELGPMQNELGITRELAKALQEGRLGDAQKKVAELSEKLRNGELSEQERESLKKELKSISESMKTNGSELSQSLAEALAGAAQSMDSQDIQGAMEAMKAAELSLEDIESMLEELKKMDGMMARLKEWEGEFLGEGAYCPFCGKKIGDCDGEGQCAGQGLGLRGAGRGQGNRLGEVPEAEGQFQPTMASGPLTKGKMLADILQRTAPEAGEEAHVDYVSGAFVELQQEAEQALTQEEIPPGSREYVRQYFGSLEPENR